MGSDFKVGSISADLRLNTAHWARGVAGMKRDSLLMGGTANSLAGSFGAIATKAGLAAAGIGAVAVAMKGLKSSVSIAIQYESAFTGVRKTVNATEAEFAKLADTFRRMSRELPMRQTELLGLAEAGGQLGIQTENLAEFADTMAKIGITTNLSSDQAATSLARWANITGLAQSDFDNLASAIVQLGNNFATTEAEIVDMGMRLSGVGKQVGMTDSDIVAMATGLSSLGLHAEMAGTAMSRMLADMASELANGGNNIQIFAALAGQSMEAFQQSFNEDALGAVLDMLEGLQKYSTAGGNAFGVLERLGLNDARMRDSVLRTAGAVDLFHNAQDMANEAIKDNAAIEREAQLRLDTTASKTEIAKNKFIELAKSIGDDVKPSFESFIELAGDVAARLSDIVTAEDKSVESVAAITDAIERMTVPLEKLSEKFGELTKNAPSFFERVSESILRSGKQFLDYGIYGNARPRTPYQAGVSGRNLSNVAGRIGMMLEEGAINGVGAVPAQVENIQDLLNEAQKVLNEQEEAVSATAQATAALTTEQEEFKNSVEQSLAASEEELNVKKALLEIEKRRTAASDMRLELFPREAMAEQLKNVLNFANEFPAIIDSEAISRAFQSIWQDFHELGITTTEDLSGYLKALPLDAQKAFEDIRAKAADTEFGLANIEPLDLSAQMRGKSILGGLSTSQNVAQEINQAMSDIMAFRRDAGITLEELAALSEQFWIGFGSMSDSAVNEAIHNIKNPELKNEILKLQQEQEDFGTQGIWAAATTAQRWQGLSNAVSAIGPKFGIAAKEAQSAGAIMSAVASAVSGDWISTAINIASAFDIFDDGEKKLSGFEKAMEGIREASEQWVDEITDAFVEFSRTGKAAWNDLFDTIMRDIQSSFIRELLVAPARDFIGDMFGFAKGGAFDNGKLIPAAKGHVTTSPEFFRFNSGELGLRGEAGSEAVLPLKRDRNGILGVNASSGGKVTVNVHNYTGADVKVQESRGDAGERILDVVIAGVRQAINGGDLDADLAINYGITR